VDRPADPVAAVTHADPYPYYAELGARPIHRDGVSGLWIAASASAVRAVLSSEHCRVRPADEPVPGRLRGSAAGDIFRLLVRMTDGADHLRAKTAVAGHLASMNPALIAQQSATAARRLADELEPARRPERLEEFAFRLPVDVIASLLGFAPDRLRSLAAWTGDLVRGLAPSGSVGEVERGTAAAERLGRAFTDLLGRPALDGLVANRIGYLSQSYEATAGLIGNTLVALGRHPEVRQRAGTDRGFLTGVVREVVRYDPSVQNTRRFVADGGTVGDQAMRAGDTVLVVIAAANRDPIENPDPARFDPLRRERLVFTFGFGPHACPGEMLATLITVSGVAELLAQGVAPERLAASVTYRASPNMRIPVFGASASA
jgi:cytochrome P450